MPKDVHRRGLHSSWGARSCGGPAGAPAERQPLWVGPMFSIVLGPGPGLGVREDPVCVGALTSWYGDRLSLSVPHSYPLLKDSNQVCFSFLSPAPSTGPGAKSVLLELKSRCV